MGFPERRNEVFFCGWGLLRKKEKEAIDVIQKVGETNGGRGYLNITKGSGPNG